MHKERTQCIIEVDTGYLISEKMKAPKGTGHTGIWVFTSLKELTEKLGSGFTKIW